MKLKGEMVIELTDTNTGAVETVQETNMITEAVNNILGLNPMGIYLKVLNRDPLLHGTGEPTSRPHQTI